MGDFNDPFMRNRDASVQGRGKVQNRANVLQLKLIGQSHPTGLTNNLLKLFEPRPPLEYKPPPEKRKCLSYSGMGQYVRNFAEPGEPEYSPPVQKGETRVQRRARIHELRLEKGATKASEELQKYDPSNDPNMTGDPYKTLFVARLNHESTEQRIKREFETYGPIKRVRLITDKETNKPRGYAFIEYMHTRDMKAAYKQADGRKLDNRRVIVDVERGRTVPNWRPRRLGGGLGSTRVGGEDLNQRYSGREQQVTSGGPPRSEEPRSRDDRIVDREREKSRDKGRERDKERERSHERTHDRGGRDHDAREDRQHRDRDRNRDRDRGRDRDRDRHRGRERDRGRDYEQDRDHPRERERDYDRAGRGRERDYGNVEYLEQKHGWNREHDNIEPEHGQGGHERDRNLRDQEKHGRGHHEPTYDLDHYEGHIEDELKQEDVMEADDDGYRNQFSRGGSEPGEAGHAGDRDYEYRRSERSLSREFDH